MGFVQLCERGLFCVKNGGVWSPMLLHNLLLCAEGSFYLTVRWTSQNETHGIMPRPMCFVTISFSVKNKCWWSVAASKAKYTFDDDNEDEERVGSDSDNDLNGSFTSKPTAPPARKPAPAPAPASPLSDDGDDDSSPVKAPPKRKFGGISDDDDDEVSYKYGTDEDDSDAAPKPKPKAPASKWVHVWWWWWWGFFQLDNCPTSCFVNLCQTVV